MLKPFHLARTIFFTSVSLQMSKVKHVYLIHLTGDEDSALSA
jgi:hypothetical protein